MVQAVLMGHYTRQGRHQYLGHHLKYWCACSDPSLCQGSKVIAIATIRHECTLGNQLRRCIFIRCEVQWVEGVGLRDGEIMGSYCSRLSFDLSPLGNGARLLALGAILYKYRPTVKPCSSEHSDPFISGRDIQTFGLS